MEDARVVLGTGKTLQIGSESWMITDPSHVGVEFVDFTTESRIYNGNLYLSFASSIIEGGGLEARICSRLRMNVVTAQSLHMLLGNMIKDILKPIDQSLAN